MFNMSEPNRVMIVNNLSTYNYDLHFDYILGSDSSFNNVRFRTHTDSAYFHNITMLSCKFT